MIFRRSISVGVDIQAVEVFTISNLRLMRPGDGASPFMLDHFPGENFKKLQKALFLSYSILSIYGNRLFMI